MFKNVIAGVDGDEGGRDAIALATDLVSEGGKLKLAYVYPGDADSHVWRGSSGPYDVIEHERGQELLETAAREAGIDAELRCHGSTSVGHGLHDLAETGGADLLVVGSSRRGVVGRVLLGDDTRAALNGASCAIAVAPAGYSQQPHLMREIGVGYNGSPEARTPSRWHAPSRPSMTQAVSVRGGIDSGDRAEHRSCPDRRLDGGAARRCPQAGLGA